jgi:hypothetical protein
MEKQLNPWGPWENNPSKAENFYDKIEEKVEVDESWEGEKEEPDYRVMAEKDKKEAAKKKKTKKVVKESIDLDEATRLEPDLGGKIPKDTHKLLTKEQNKDEDELTDYEKEVTEEVKEDPYASILKDLK